MDEINLSYAVGCIIVVMGIIYFFFPKIMQGYNKIPQEDQKKVKNLFSVLGVIDGFAIIVATYFLSLYHLESR